MDNGDSLGNQLLDNAVEALGRLPGVGRKTALRLALHLLRRDEGEALALGKAIIDMRSGITYCTVCHNISESDTCPVCLAAEAGRRDAATVCVVESIKDVMALERTGRYTGVYHVLGGLISPMEGVGPDTLEIASLLGRVAQGGIAEVILALSATMEGDTTAYYIHKMLRNGPRGEALRVTQLARGMSVGNELEYTDEVTLARSLMNRIDFSMP